MNDILKKALLKDRLYDKKSLIYENGEIAEIEDSLDDDHALEGSLGHFAKKRVDTELGINFFLPLTKKSRTLESPEYVVDMDMLYQIQSSNRFFSLEKMENINIEDLIERYNEDEDLIPITDENNQWTGIISCDSENKMLGFIEIFRDKSNVLHILKYAGTGNYTEIRVEKNNIMRSIIRRNLR